MSDPLNSPMIAVVHLRPIEHHVEGLVIGEARTIKLDHQANQEVCEAVQRMLDRTPLIPNNREDQS